MAIPSGILTNGLGGGATSMLLGQFNLGFITVTIEPEPPTPPPSAPPTLITRGAGGDYEQPLPQNYKISFVIRHKKHTWTKEYLVSRTNGLVLIRITKTINKVRDKIKIVVKGIKKKIGNIGISLWKR